MARLLLFFLLTIQILTAHAQDNPVVHTVFLIGDSGEPEVANSSIGTMLREQIQVAGGPSTVLYLGDNIYPKGLPPGTGRARELGEQVLRTQASWVRDLPRTEGIIIPGNHDWQQGGPKGLEYILEQGQFVDSLGQPNFRFLPQDGCPGPLEIPLADNAVLVIIDTQWLLHPWDKPHGDESTCDAKTTADVMTQLEDIFRRNARKRVIVAAHHPLITYGEHGGVATAKDHLFPLTQLNKNLYVPMPGIGSLYPLYRKWLGNIQDTQHPIYKAFSRDIQKIMTRYPGSIYAAGHEHALEYIVKDNVHIVVSGAGSKHTFVRKKKYARMVASVNGFTQISFRANGQAIITYWQVDPARPHREVIFADTIASPSVTLPMENALPDFSQKTVRVKASDQYQAGNTKMKFFGANYRAEWGTEVEAPVFDIGTEKGGLKILQKGGGQQTLSLRMADANGREYVLRSVEKFPENAVPEMFRKTFAQDIVQDQISASHPYAALVVPALAAAAGIYHTNPRLVYIPNDPRLGEYQKDFANTLALFEERPAGSWPDAPYFGNSDKIVNTAKVLEKLQKDNENQVDQQFVLRSRLFDMWIGDWDRHDDQWRWATFEDKKGERYRPIPRDRDQAFFLNDGTVSRIWGRRWALPKFEGFKDHISWPSGLSFNARFFDRSFLTGLSEADWIAAARDLERNMTDSVIEQSIRQWPPQITALHGDQIISYLKARRVNMVRYAVDHYRFLAREVDVVGSDKDDWFTAERDANGNVLVTVYNINKAGEKGARFYQRLFKAAETREIRLWAQGGKDRVDLTGAYSHIKIRVIGGKGKDIVNDESPDARQTVVYDQPDGVAVLQGHVKDRTSADPEVNTYDRRAFKYDRLVPLVYGNYNPDDGLFIGGGFMSFNNGFRKTPFKSKHFFLATVAPHTWSYNFRYQGQFTQAIGAWDLDVDFNLKAPNYVNNFFGMGNETVFDKNAAVEHGVSSAVNYYRFRFEELLLETAISRKVGASGTFRIGPVLQHVEVEEPAGHNRYIDQEYAPTLPYLLFEEPNTYAGGAIEYSIDKRNNPLLTTRGINLHILGRGMAGLDERASSFGALEGSVTFYQSFRLPARVVFAWRIGGGHNFGDYEFYQAQILSGKTELRGFRKTRFYGDSKAFSNLELRIKLADIHSYLFPASLGILAFNDIGRVWYKDASGVDPSAGGKSSMWHSGFGGGIWFTPFNMAVLSVEAGHSTEGTLAYVRLGFLF